MITRRDFVGAGAAAVLVPAAVRAGIVTTSAPRRRTASGGGGGAGNTWAERSTAPGVVWSHAFDSDAEVNAFRWANGYGSGNDPNATSTLGPNVRRVTTDGINGGACLEILHPVGNADGIHWWRPFSPIAAPGNGKATDDAGANGSLTPQSYSATNGGSQMYDWSTGSRPGWYGHSDYHSGTLFDGTDFYVQMRVKADPRRTTSGNSQVGKLLFLTTTRNSLTNQELVTYSGAFPVAGIGKPNYHRMYAAGSPPLEDLDSLARPGQQVGSDLANYGASQYCDVSNASLRAYCWNYSGGWDTLLYHVTPGHAATQDTRVECWAAHEGDSAYTKLWDEIVTLSFDAGTGFEKGWNALLLSAYNNGNTESEFWHRYTHVILSKDTIPCPPTSETGVRVPTYASGVAVNQIVEIANTKLSDQPVMAGQASNADKQDAWCGWAGDTQSNKLYSAGQGGHGNYHGNEVEVIDLSRDAPAWNQLIASSVEADVTFSSGFYSDGRPASTHGYHTSVHVGTLGRVLRFWGGSMSSSGFPLNDMTAFDITGGAWDTQSDWTGVSAPYGIGDGQGAYAKHPWTDVVYCWVYVDRITKWTPGVPGSLTTIISNPSNPAPFYTAGAVDPTRGTNGEGIAFFLGGGVGGGGNFCRALDIGAGTLSTITLTGTDISGFSGMSLAYSEVTDRYYAVVPDASAIRVLEITPTSGTSWACSEISYTGTGPIVDTSSNTAFYPYSKPQYMPNINNAVADADKVGGIFYSPRWGTNIWFLRLH